MTPTETRLLIGFLADYSDTLARRGCNDWDWPEDWTTEERRQWWREYHAFNRSPPQDLADDLADPEPRPPSDFMVVALLAHKLGATAHPEAP